jgi:NADH-quinone oxidoreductase subunit M
MSASFLLLLIVVLWLYRRFDTFDYPTIAAALSGPARLPLSEDLWLFAVFFSAFAIIVPLVPLHTWLLDVHAEAPAGVSALIAGILLKIGAYGLLRFCLPLYPGVAHVLSPAVLVLAIVGIIYGSVAALMQSDLKRLIAYSCIAHLGLLVLGLFSFNTLAIQGVIYQMLNHGLTIGIVLLMIGMIDRRIDTTDMARMGGLAQIAPAFAGFFLIVVLSSVGLPLLNNFVGWLLILRGLLQERVSVFIIAAVGLVFTAAYMLRMYQRVFLGNARERHDGFRDVNLREKALLVTSIGLMLFMGLGSRLFLDRTQAATLKLLDQVRSREIRVEQTAPEIHRHSTSKLLSQIKSPISMARPNSDRWKFRERKQLIE